MKYRIVITAMPKQFYWASIKTSVVHHSDLIGEIFETFNINDAHQFLDQLRWHSLITLHFKVVEYNEGDLPQ